MPVFPPVASTIVAPGCKRPLRSASSINASPRRSFTLPHGLRISSLATMRPGRPREMRASSTIGVLPTVAVTAEKSMTSSLKRAAEWWPKRLWREGQRRRLG